MTETSDYYVVNLRSGVIHSSGSRCNPEQLKARGRVQLTKSGLLVLPPDMRLCKRCWEIGE